MAPGAAARGRGRPPLRRPRGRPPAAAGPLKRPAAAAGPVRKRPAAAGGAGAGEERPARRAKVQGCYEQFRGGAIPEPAVPRPRPQGGGFKVIAWNVAGLRAFLQKRAGELQRLVEQERPAALGFIEHKLQPGDQVDEAVAALKDLLPGYVVQASAFSASVAKKGYSGVALLWRSDVEGAVLRVKREKLEPGPSEGRTLCMELPGLFAVLTYVPNSGDGLCRLEERLGQWDPKLRRYLKGLAKRKPVLLIGDLNVAHRDLDIWNLEAPHVPKQPSTTPEERASFGKLLDAGFVDGFAHMHPDLRGAFSYWSVRAGGRKPNRGLRLDYAVVSEGLASGGAAGGARLLDAFHLPAFAPAGDHCPIGATIQLPQG